MILELEHWHLGYEQILNDCRPAGEDGSPGTVYLLCNTDADAMACARILSYMLRLDGIPYQLMPCASHSMLHKYLLSSPTQDIRAVVLLNFGASQNLTKYFDNDQIKDVVKIYVMDCRRPVHLANIYAGENVVIFWDQTQSNDFPSDGDNLSGNESSSSSGSSDDDSDDSDDGDEGEAELGQDSDDGEEEAGFDDVVRGEPSTTPPIQETEDELGNGYDGEDEGEEANNRSSPKDDGDELDDDSMAPIAKRRKVRESGDGNNELPSTTGTDNNSAGDVQNNDDVADSSHPADSQQLEVHEEQPKLSPRELHRQRRDRLHQYYTSGTFFGSPAAYIAYQLANQMRFGENGDLLWLACVGVTDAYLHSRLDVVGYSTLVVDLRRLCLRLFPNDMYQRTMSAVFAEDLTGAMSRAGVGIGQDRTKITFSENGRILSEKDYRFFLLRHSSLFDAMAHSDYISTRLQVWTKRGLHNLQELLAKMGYPLEECRQPFAFMKPNLKRRLQEKILSYSQEYGLENFEFTSFFRVTGYQSLLSASDTSYAVTALLEYNQASMTDGEYATDSEESESISSFHLAYDALNPNMTNGLPGLLSEGHDSSSLVNGGNLSGNTGIGAGIRLAMSMQREIISTAVNLVDQNAITRLRHFRYAYITCTSAGENQSHRTADLMRSAGVQKDDEANKAHIFAKPLALNRLAHYLMDMHRENGKWVGAKARPLVLMAEKPRTGTYLVVGYEYPERAGSFVKNKFGKHFHFTSKSMRGTIKFDSFDSNVVEVGASDVQRFIEQLHYLLDSI